MATPTTPLSEQVFADEAFDPYSFVEEALSERNGNVAELSVLVPQLTLLSQSLTKSIHTSLHQLTVLLPQVQSQVDVMHKAVQPLAQQLDDVVAQVEHPAPGKSAHRKKVEERDLQHLTILHETKQRVTACSQSLVEAAKWGRNVRTCFAAIDEPVEDQMVMMNAKTSGRAPATLADRVREMRQSLEILQDMPGADDRRRTMDSLCRQIETSMKPKLVEALREDPLSTAKVRFCLQIFDSIQSRDVVQAEYSTHRQAHVHRFWFAYNEDEEDSVPFCRWLQSFYAEVLKMLHKEVVHATEIFGADVALVMESLLQHTLATLKEAFRDRLKKCFSMAALVEAFQNSAVFAEEVAKLFRSLESKKNVRGGSDAGHTIVDVVFGPYQAFFNDYAQLAEDALMTDLRSFIPAFKSKSATDDEDMGSSQCALEEFSQQLEEVAEKVWSAVDDSIRVCYDFSAGGAYPDVAKAITSALQRYFTELTTCLPSVRNYCSLSSAAEADNAAGSSLGTLHTAHLPDWTKFHGALALLRACGTLETQFEGTESRVRARMGEQLMGLIGSDLRASPRSRKKQMTVAPLADLLETSAIVAAVSKIWLHEDPARWNDFQAFAFEFMRPQLHDPSAQFMLFTGAQESMVEWTRQVQYLTYDTILAPVTNLLAAVAQNPVWAKKPDDALGDLPTFSTLPQEYITTVADLLLSLLPQLEQFAESSSLQQALVASHNVQQLALREWTRLGKVLRLSEDEIAACQRIFVIAAEESEESNTATEFVDLWTGTIASGSLASLLHMICSIPRFSDVGSKQLSADLGYFHNVLSALGVTQNFVVDELRQVLDLTVEAHSNLVEEKRAQLATTDPTDASVHQRSMVVKLINCVQNQRSQPGAELDRKDVTPQFH
ncbi:TPA: hypothetical protein N0F65_009595 [Lagenidium giganteum]|uniref:Conserved oligomeric Golgi complex subunit 7 n=1 Tax=Lagenidium giganteum TaxID=4803 RepID=A0AAV2YHB7_9STRA|nr:TPA: hypothetical protein N0F65_009595 [Lagenidium giganteum]